MSAYTSGSGQFHRAWLCCLLVALGLSREIAQAQIPGFQGLGDLAGGGYESRASDVSADGLVVVGASWSAFGYKEAFRWTQAGGMVGLGDLGSPGGTFDSYATGVSADGSVVVGTGSPDVGSGAFRWTESGGMVALSGVPEGIGAWSLDVSADGAVVVGTMSHLPSVNDYQAFRWTQSTGVVGLGYLPGWPGTSFATGASADGSVVVGHTGNSSVNVEAFRWTQSTGMVGLGDISPGGYFSSYALDVSPDGSVVVGYDGNSLGPANGTSEAFRWTETGGMLALGDLPGGYSYSQALGVSADGSVVVGFGHSDSGQEAFIWDSVNGMRNLRDALTSEYGLDLTGWTLTEADAVTSNGLTMVGYGINPSGQTEAWIATIPEPSTWALVALGFGLITRRRLVHKRQCRVWVPEKDEG